MEEKIVTMKNFFIGNLLNCFFQNCDKFLHFKVFFLIYGVKKIVI